MLKIATSWLVFMAVVIQGLSAGAMLGEQQTLVPFWQELAPNDFFAWYAENGSRLKEFFAPLQIAGAVLTIVALILCVVRRHPGTIWMGISMLFALAVLATFFLFFKDVNTGFATQSIPPEELSGVLVQWSNWQWARIIMGISAFSTALYGACLGARL